MSSKQQQHDGARAKQLAEIPPKAGTIIMRSVSMFLTSGRRRTSHYRRSKSQTVPAGQKRLMRPKMDETQGGKLNPKTMEMLKRKTRFTKEELEALCRIYRKLVSNSAFSSRRLPVNPASVMAKAHATIEGIDRIVFRELLHSTFDIVTEETLIERIFCNWDKLHEGLPLKLEGWLIGLSVFLRGTLAEKAAFCFRVYDLNGDGFITKDEMFALLRNCLIKHPQDEDPDEGVKDLVEIILKKFDIDKDGKVSFEDFSKTVTDEPLILEAFGQCLPTESATLSFFATLET